MKRFLDVVVADAVVAADDAVVATVAADAAVAAAVAADNAPTAVAVSV